MRQKRVSPKKSKKINKKNTRQEEKFLEVFNHADKHGKACLANVVIPLLEKCRVVFEIFRNRISSEKVEDPFLKALLEEANREVLSMIMVLYHKRYDAMEEDIMTPIKKVKKNTKPAS